MCIIHFLNVKEGDCSLIEHNSGHKTVIDICNGNDDKEKKLSEEEYQEQFFSKNKSSSIGIKGHFKQKEYPVNPIEYFKEFGIKEIFRFILTHPDMDHMDGIKNLFTNFKVHNFWDTNNKKTMNESDFVKSKYCKKDWDYYQYIRAKKDKGCTVLKLQSGAEGKYYNKWDDEGMYPNGDGIYILSPNKVLIDDSNDKENYNDSSYVLLYKDNNKRIIFSGDSEERAWDYILENFKKDIKDIDILIAPHHGRKSGGNDKFLDILKPKLTLFGNAKSEHLNYDSWNNRKLEHITNNQANCILLDINSNSIDVYVANKEFCKSVDKKLEQEDYIFYKSQNKNLYSQHGYYYLYSS